MSPVQDKPRLHSETLISERKERSHGAAFQNQGLHLLISSSEGSYGLNKEEKPQIPLCPSLLMHTTQGPEILYDLMVNEKQGNNGCYHGGGVPEALLRKAAATVWDKGHLGFFS